MSRTPCSLSVLGLIANCKIYLAKIFPDPARLACSLLLVASARWIESDVLEKTCRASNLRLLA
jgi:hypothetical protein